MIFAVSRLLHSKHVKSIFEKYDFHVKASDKQYFVNRFKTKKISEAKISKKEFLEMIYEQGLCEKNKLKK